MDVHGADVVAHGTDEGDAPFNLCGDDVDVRRGDTFCEEPRRNVERCDIELPAVAAKIGAPAVVSPHGGTEFANRRALDRMVIDRYADRVGVLEFHLVVFLQLP
jgi:hypothetical protein